MNWLDIVILCLGIVGLIKGFADGMIRQVVSVAAMILGLYLSSGAAGWVSGYLTQLDWIPEWLVYPVSYFLGFVIIVGIILFAGNVIHKLVSFTPLGIINKLVGALLGLLLMVFFMSLILMIVERFDSNSALIPSDVKDSSFFYNGIKDFIQNVLPGNLFDFNIDSIKNDNILNINS